MGVFIGADGGASKLMLCLSAGGTRRFSKVPQCVNPVVCGQGVSADIIIGSMLGFCEREGVSPASVDGVFAGIAGATERDYITMLKTRLQKTFPAAACGVSHDGENIIYAAFPESDGVALICGTGSSCFVRKGGELFRIGGYGAFDMDGSGYEIGRRAIAYTLKSYDGRARRTPLCELTEKLAGGNCLQNLSRLLSLSVRETAQFAAAVFEAAAENDAVALYILDATARYLACCVDAASRYFESRFDVCIAGGVGTNKIITKKIKQYALPQANIFTLIKEPAEGAVTKAEKLYDERNNS